MRVGGKIGSATAKLDAFFMHKCTLNCALFDVTFVWIFALDSRIFFPAFREYKLFLTLLGSKFLFFLSFLLFRISSCSLTFRFFFTFSYLFLSDLNMCFRASDIYPEVKMIVLLKLLRTQE